MKNGKCKTCGIRALNQQTGKLVCSITGLPAADDGYCDHHTYEVDKCALCGAPLIIKDGTLIVQFDDGNYGTLCHQCMQQYGTCHSCTHLNECKFMDTSYRPDLPPVIMKTVQQGMMMVQTQVKNPDRENECCPGCTCYDVNNGCLASILGTCQSYHCRQPAP